ncbi:hypothetical protein [Massilia sp. NR 4-1]|uniref:hypothetical protein n=1 Tax=Massilia sp. NR 4-1 TaxID=1678028 RepID=UPI00067BF420|nr:hypothetical protein [Massilia sp. NR 4-1]AKU23441.1 hypothetical protein ACZ75_20245 [Massilia sp. NR 4-1]
MRIVIETDEQSGAAGSRSVSQATADPSAVQSPAREPERGAAASDAGPPSAQLLQAIGEAGAYQPAHGGARDGVDGGGPPLELVQALRRVPSEAGARAPEAGGNGGGAPL